MAAAHGGGGARKKTQGIGAAASAAGYDAALRCAPLLQELLEDAEPEVRLGALQALPCIGAQC